MRLENPERSPDFRTGLVPLEMVREFISANSLAATAQLAQNFVGGRIAQAVPKDKAG